MLGSVVSLICQALYVVASSLRLSTIWCLIILCTLNVILAAIYCGFQGLIGDSSSDAMLLLDESLTSPDPHTSNSKGLRNNQFCKTTCPTAR